MHCSCILRKEHASLRTVGTMHDDSIAFIWFTLQPLQILLHAKLFLTICFAFCLVGFVILSFHVLIIKSRTHCGIVSFVKLLEWLLNSLNISFPQNFKSSSSSIACVPYPQPSCCRYKLHQHFPHPGLQAPFPHDTHALRLTRWVPGPLLLSYKLRNAFTLCGCSLVMRDIGEMWRWENGALEPRNNDLDLGDIFLSSLRSLLWESWGRGF